MYKKGLHATRIKNTHVRKFCRLAAQTQGLPYFHAACSHVANCHKDFVVRRQKHCLTVFRCRHLIFTARCVGVYNNTIYLWCMTLCKQKCLAIFWDETQDPFWRKVTTLQPFSVGFIWHTLCVCHWHIKGIFICSTPPPNDSSSSLRRCELFMRARKGSKLQFTNTNQDVVAWAVFSFDGNSWSLTQCHNQAVRILAQ